MLVEQIEDRVYFKSGLLENVQSISHCFTSKLGGVSQGKIEGLNLGFRVGDDIDAVRENYNLVATDFGFPIENITGAKQIHSASVTVITKDLVGCGISRLDEVFETDSLVTNLKNVPLTVFYADCVPILLVDEVHSVVAAVHSGWRGTVAKIAKHTIEVMIKEFGCEPKNIKAAVGPSIGKCCFETGAEVALEFDEDLAIRQKDGKFKVDLWEANSRILRSCGLLSENIEILGICTVCEKDRLYSYRMHKEQTGRMGAFIEIK